LYVLAFDGKIQAIDNQHKISLVATLPDNVQAYKIKYQEQKIYLATNKGLWIFDQIRNQWQTINKLSGLASDNVQDLLILGRNVWLATGKGLQKIPIHSQTETQKALIYLRSIKIDSQVVTDLNDLQLHYNQQLILHPEASNYSSNGNFQYKYQFAHNPNTWDYLPANVNQLVIPNIPLGEFELRLKVIDQHGNDSENTIIIKGFVSPPFWKTQWFFMLCLLVFLAVAYFIFDGNIKRLRKKQAKAIERLQLESELREMQQTALKAQMNPHFIFNVLNSIKSYIYKNDKIKASTYLNSFSDLMRTVLDMSNANSVSLEDELRAIKIYIELEAMMLGDDFSYSINIDSDNISSHTKIPALIIQPYVENAFKHGLKNKTGKKTLQLDVYLSPQKNLIIEITDNGIGRQAAQLLQQQQPHYHQSFATHAIEKRINLINNEGQQYITFAIIDLKTDDNQPAGTKIILTLTLK
jgi:two-component sensor histidine kinase